MGNQAFQGEGGREGVERMITSRAENMRATMEMVGREYGGVEAYLREKCGLGDDEIEKMRTLLVANGQGRDAAVL